jgi:hypothetical protein
MRRIVLRAIDVPDFISPKTQACISVKCAGAFARYR